jgi:acyl-CoA synthetase (AMP-forming)/AMP-acid ligase II/acyl carrier protein
VSEFESCGFDRRAFCPGYGLAESTLKVTATRRGEGPYVLPLRASDLERNVVAPAPPGETGARSMVGCGSAERGTEIRIVDPERLEPCPPSRVGEIWVASPSVARGYWNRPEESASTFEAVLEDRRYLRTGDLGFLWPPSNSHLFITGRLKDLVIIRGRNHYPQDIELTAERSHDALLAGASAAFSIEAGEAERLAVAIEIHRHRASEADAAIDAIRRAVADEHEVAPAAVLLVKQGRIPKTSSGKIQRRLCAKAFSEGTLALAAEWREREAAGPAPETQRGDGVSIEAIESFLCRRLASQLGVSADSLDSRTPFQELGLDSAGALTILGELEGWVGRPLSPTLFWNYPTIADLAAHLDPSGTNDGS